jgi:hypothetical protein
MRVGASHIYGIKKARIFHCLISERKYRSSIILMPEIGGLFSFHYECK